MSDEDALRAELEQVKRERDMYKKALLTLLPVPDPPTPEELAQMEGNGLTMADVVRHVKARHGLPT
jgi:hypothetical protein